MLINLLLASRMPAEIGQASWVVAVSPYLAYYFIQEGAWSTTLGKDLFKARPDGSECGWRAAAIRTVTRFVEDNPVLLGVLPGGPAVALSKGHQRVGDMLSRSV